MRTISRMFPVGLRFILPTLILWLVWDMWPFIYSIYLSFTSWDLMGAKNFVGIDNYRALAGDPLFWKSLRNTLLWLVFTVPLGVILSLALALAINSTNRLKEFLRVTYFLPVITPIAAVSLVWSYLYQPNFGFFNLILSLMGINGPDWLLDPNTALISVGIMSLWHRVGFNMVVYLAALQTIPQSYYEAASIDGASVWRKIRSITLPMLKPVTLFVIIMSSIQAFGSFTEIYIMTEGGPMRATTFLSYYLYELGFTKLQMGYASSIAIILFVLMFGLTMFLFYLMNRRSTA
ncbi:MAG: sugar ABC transporter permease [Dehalococcoidales bacterium]|nr:sugar ABC transporter permease [Dehalococcoidales bacterium]